MTLDTVDKTDYGAQIRLLGFGVLIWLVPFLVSFLFYSPQGTPLIGAAFFNSIMSVVLIVIVSISLFRYFTHFSREYLREAIVAGIFWFIMSIVLDVVFLMPLAKLSLVAYVTDIALGYLVIPIVAILCGYLLEVKGEHNKKIFSQIFSTK